MAAGSRAQLAEVNPTMHLLVAEDDIREVPWR
jgi:hypothetical protein